MRDLRLCFVGDSFVNGTGDREGLGWTGRLCRAVPDGIAVTRYELGVRRDTSARIRQRCAAEVAARLDGVPDGRIVLSFGANDAAWEEGRVRVMPDGTVRHAHDLLAWASARWPTLLVGPPPIADDAAHDARVAALVPVLARVAAEQGVPFLDLHAPLRADPVWRAEALAGDGVHPGAAGYARAAAVVAAWAAWRAWLT